MKDDPFASLSGLDQQLFQDKPNNATTKQRSSATTPLRDIERGGEVAKPRANDPPQPPALAPAKEAANTGANEAMRTRASAPRGQRENARLVDRHSHDIFYDQVRWMNRLKLEIEEEYDTKVTSNGMVQVAIDMLRRDYDANGEQSELMRALVFGDSESTALPANVKRRRR